MSHRWSAQIVQILAPGCVFLTFLPLRNVGDNDLLSSSVTAWGWCFTLTGSVLLLCLCLAGRYLRRRTADEASEAGSPLVGNWLAAVLAVTVLIAVVALLQTTDMSWGGFSRAGPFTVAYSVSRFVLSIFLLVACFTLGALTVRAILGGGVEDGIDESAYFILCFFGGASLYGLLFVAIGLLGLLSLPATLLLTVPILCLSPWVGRRVWHSRCRQVRSLLNPGDLGGWVRVHLAWCAFASGVFLLLTRGLYPGQTSNDVWEHYLPYYREVLQSGSVGPNDLWYHFHGSKGAGLFFLLGSLSDELSVQLVSWCFILLTGLIVYRVLVRLFEDSSWGLFGVAVFFSVYRGDFFKHHDVLMGLLCFLVWASIEIRTHSGRQRQAIALMMALTAFYLGFYQSMGAAIVAGFWSVLICCTVGFRSSRREAYLLARLLAVLIAGVGTTLALNYHATGLAETVPLRFFWALADTEKFGNVFGFSGVAHLLHSEIDRLHVLSGRLEWRHFEQAFRYQHFWVFCTPWMAILAVTVGSWQLVRNRPWKALSMPGYPVVVLTSFFVSALLLSALVHNVSLVRLYIFTTFLMTIGVVTLYRWLLNSLSVNSVRPYAHALFLSVLSVHAIGQSFWYSEAIWGLEMTSVARFFIGQHSLADVLAETDGRFDKPVTLATATNIRGVVGPQPKIVDLGSNPGPVYTYPGAGLIGGVNHSFGPEHLDIMFGPPEGARAALRRKEWNYFLFDLRNTFLDCLPYSVLFQPENLNKHLAPVYQQGDTYLLTWRRPGDARPIPVRFRQVLELKQKGSLRYPFTKEFARDLDETVRRQLLSLESDFHGPLVASAIAEMLSVGVGAELVVEQNTKLVAGLAWYVQQSLEALAPEAEAGARQWSAQPDPQTLPLARYRSEFSRLLLGPIRAMATWYCNRELGAAVAATLMTTDEPPVAQMYASREAFEELVGVGDPSGH